MMAADVPAILDTTEFADTITHWPGGDSSAAASVTGIFEELDTSGLADPAIMDDRQGRAVKRVGAIELADSVTVTAGAVEAENSVFVWGGLNWRAVRVTKAVHGMQSVLVVACEVGAVSKGRVRG